MHPDDTSGSSGTAFTQSTSLPSHQTTQYGFSISASASPPLRVDSREAGAGGVIGDSWPQEGYTEGATRLNAAEGTSTVGTPPSDRGSESPSKKDTIRKYEAMGTSPTSDTAFHVKKTNWGGRKDSPISRFPNEVLIHALSFLDPQTLLSAALISRRFHSLVTSSHAWQSAFSRYFPSPLVNSSSFDAHESAAFSSSQDRRYFTCLSGPENNGNAWRKEYILRTRLLRSLARGKANISTNLTTPISHNSHGSVVITYPAATGAWSVSHIAANFTPRGVRLLHASVHTPGVVSASDPTTGKVERPPLETFVRAQQRPDFHQPLLGLHGYEVATDMGTSGVIDLSEDIGWVYGENVSRGKVYIHPYTSPYIAAGTPGLEIRPDHESIDGFHPAVTSVWIAKKRSTGVLETTEGRVGVVVGNSRGVVSIYGLSFGKENKLAGRKKFCVSPGVPIVSIKVDDDYSVKRMRQKNVWIVVINALGEVYYLRKSPNSWEIIPQTARAPTALYASTFTLSRESLTKTEWVNWKKTRDERLMKMDYGQVKEIWGGWGMDWFVEVDWANQNVVVGKKQSIERRSRPEDDAVGTDLYRYHLALRTQIAGGRDGFVRELVVSPAKEPRFTVDGVEGSVFGGVITDSAPGPEKDVYADKGVISSVSKDGTSDIWVATHFTLGEKSMHIITATAMDNSNLALMSDREGPSTEGEVPGGNARLFAVGTHMGSIFVWNLRSPASSAVTGVTGAQSSLRVIHTDSPQISSLALSSLYLVHGGTDGLVQAWDPLASTLLPVRNIHSKFSSRARRRIAQADAGAQEEFGVGDNQFAARCLTLDPDATSLRGAVALGTFIRYWSFSSTSSESDKKRRKPGPRSRASGAPSRGRSAIKAVIESESKYHLKLKEQERKEKEELRNRYGVASGREALSEEEMVEYATMISRETFELESGGSVASWEESANSSRTVTPDEAPSVSSYGTADEYKSPVEGVNDAEDLELAEALRLSLLEVGGGSGDSGGDGRKPHQTEEVWEDAEYLYSDSGPTHYSSPIRYTAASSSKLKNRSPKNSYGSTSSPPVRSGGWERLPLDQLDEWPSVSGKGKGKGKVKGRNRVEEGFETELEMAIRLSLMEEEERRAIMEALEGDEEGKGKGRA